LEEVPREVAALPTGQDASAFRLRVRDLPLDDLDLARERHRAQVVRRLARRALPEGLHPFGEERLESVRDALLHVDPLGADADLPAVNEARPGRRLGGTREVRAREDHERRLPAELGDARDETLAGSRGHLPTGRDG